MELIGQHAKKIMEECKERALDAGLRFDAETLEYIVTNRDLLELSPKLMIPTLYDYWVHDVEVLKEKGKYELYPGNPYETVINTRPAISYYNDNNPDWLNVMIFYHVLGHIDFFQNNHYFRHTWDDDFAGQALSDKRVIARLRSEKGRWLDYVIEFSRGVDNLVGYHRELSDLHRGRTGIPRKVDYYFDIFLQTVRKASTTDYIKKIERYNECLKESPSHGEDTFFSEVKKNHPEFTPLFQKHLKARAPYHLDPLQYVAAHSEFLNQEGNRWMKTVLEVVRRTALFFQPQIRTKIMNEGWASYWHDKLFLADPRIRGHEVDYARVNAGVTAMPRVGLNPYALGMRLFEHIERSVDQGRHTFAYERLRDARQRERFDSGAGGGKEAILRIREDMCDFTFINTFVDQDFVNRYRLFVAGKRLNKERMVWEYYVKSRSAGAYREMLFDSLYHPPHIVVAPEKAKDGSLYLDHRFEGKPLLKDYIPNTLMGLEYLWHGPVQLETTELVPEGDGDVAAYLAGAMGIPQDESKPRKMRWQRVVYTMGNRKLNREVVDSQAEARAAAG
jgi:stage V sporulation protein R